MYPRYVSPTAPPADGVSKALEKTLTKISVKLRELLKISL